MLERFGCMKDSQEGNVTLCVDGVNSDEDDEVRR